MDADVDIDDKGTLCKNNNVGLLPSTTYLLRMRLLSFRTSPIAPRKPTTGVTISLGYHNPQIMVNHGTFQQMQLHSLYNVCVWLTLLFRPKSEDFTIQLCNDLWKVTTNCHISGTSQGSQVQTQYLQFSVTLKSHFAVLINKNIIDPLNIFSNYKSVRTLQRY